MPNCPDRQAMAVLLARTALDFLVLQELGHIRNGHLGFLSGRTPTEMLETEVLAAGPKDARARHTLEMDADSHPVVHTVNAALSFTGANYRN
jgi:hypothetical protein